MAGGKAVAHEGEELAEGIIAKAAKNALRDAEGAAGKSAARDAERGTAKAAEHIGERELEQTATRAGAEHAGEVATRQTQADIDRAAIKELSDAGDIDGARDILRPHLDKGDPQAIVDRLDVSSPRDKGFLWSGDKEAAGREAASRGGVTLEQTSGGRVIDNWDELDKAMPWDKGGEQVWGGTSRNYAGQLTGDVRSFQTLDRFPQGGYVFQHYELPEVKAGLKSGRITSYAPEQITP